MSEDSKEQNRLKRSKTYKGMTKPELIEKIVTARVEECKKDNEKRYHDGIPRTSEDPEVWRNHYKSYPVFSKKYPAFSLSAEYDRYYEKSE